MIMMIRAFVVLAMVAVTVGSPKVAEGPQGTTPRRRFNQGHKIMRKPGEPYVDRVLSQLPQGPVPDQWLWNDVNGTNYLTVMRNQHIPQYCGACWAFSATSALSDRIKIERKAEWPDVLISPQVLLSCGMIVGDGCHGGEASLAYEWMSYNNMTDETCSIYQARGHDNGLGCSDISICETCDDEGCRRPKQFHRFQVHEFGRIQGSNVSEHEQNMMAEIYHRGPIACGISVTDELMNYTGGVFVDKTGSLEIDHDISVVGYGVDKESGLKYWLIRNSWGTYWGEGGFLKLVRGINNLAIESGICSWATPKNMDLADDSMENEATTGQDIMTNEIRVINDDWPPLSEEVKGPAGLSKDGTKYSIVKTVWKMLQDLLVISTDASLSKRPIDEPIRLKQLGCHTPFMNYTKGPLILTALPQDYVATKDLPKTWDWRNIDGVNYLSWSVNQHIPKYCGSCWAQASVSSLADRFIIADPKRFANLALAVQVIINCRAGGSCEGGNAPGVHEFAHEYGIPDSTCMQYDANDDQIPMDCSKPGLNICRNCEPPIPREGESGIKHCWPVTNFTRYHASEYGSVRGAMNMKKEIYKRGPIACGVRATDKFLAYTGGVYSEHLLVPMINHLISVVGWGYDVETGKEYWVGRNSWGTYWGEQGFFRIEMHKNNLFIESDCYFAVPKTD